MNNILEKTLKQMEGKDPKKEENHHASAQAPVFELFSFLAGGLERGGLVVRWFGGEVSHVPSARTRGSISIHQLRVT